MGATKNFYKDFETEKDLRKKISDLSYQTDSIRGLLLLVNQEIGRCLVTDNGAKKRSCI